MNESLVTIAIPNYNYGSFIEKSIESAFNQTYPNIEIIIVDNCSTDDSMQVINKYKDKKNVKIFSNNKNIGAVNNFNRCYEYSNGEFIVFLSSDDILRDTFVEECIEVFNKYNVGMVCAEVDYINKSEKITENLPYYKHSCIIPSKEQARIFMLGNGFIPSQVLIKKKCMKDVGAFNCKYSITADWNMWFKISLNNDIGYLNRKLVLYRIHDNESSESIKNLTTIFEFYLLKKDFANQVINNEYLSEFIDESIKKLARNSIKYSIQMIKIKKYDIAKKYLDISKVFDSTVIEKNSYKTLDFILNNNFNEDKYDLYERLKDLMVDEYILLQKPYDIPSNSKII